MTKRLALSELAQNYPASGIRKMFDLARQYPDAIDLTCGDPNFDTPLNVREAAKKALDEGYTHYAPNAGLPELREAIAKKYSTIWKGCSPHQVIVTVGALEGLTLALLAILDKGDEVLVPDPSFANYIGQIMIAGGRAVKVPVYEENGYQMQAGDLEKAITPKTKAVILNSPSNPLGSILTREEVYAIADVIKKHDLFLLSDEPYDTIVFDEGAFTSFGEVEEIHDQLFLLNSFSKAYAMTGWRVGYMIFNPAYEEVLAHMQEGIVSCVSTFIQKAAVEALTGPQQAQADMTANYLRRRDLLTDGLNAIPGFICKPAAGSFYAFVNIKAFGKTSQEFAEELVREAHVVTVPGSAFGEMGEGYLRLVFANSDENLKEAVKRIQEFVHKKYPDLLE